MGPSFTSRDEWMTDPHPSASSYARAAVGVVVRANLLGFVVLVLAAGASDPYWRSLPVFLVFAVCLVGGSGFSMLLFRREWWAARETYGPKPIPEAR